MSPRKEPPDDPRSRDSQGADRRASGRGSGPRRSGIGAARSYTPRARTVRDTGPLPRDRDDDDAPERPDLRVVPGGRRERPRDDRRPSRPARERKRPEPKEIAPPALGEPRRRVRLAGALVMLMMVVVGLRLIQFQVAGDPALAAEGLNQRVRTEDIAAPRGAILDRDGAVLAHSVEARSVYVDPTMLATSKRDPVQTAAALSPLLGRAASDLLPLLSPHNQPDSTNPSRFEWLARGVSIDTGNSVAGLDIPGVVVVRSERRDVPGADLAANIIGFTGDDMHGLAGLEARFDDKLAGVPGWRKYEVGIGEHLGQEIPGGYHQTKPAQQGSSIQLTIDRDLQYEVQRILRGKMESSRAAWGAAVVMDAHTSEVLAQASWPTYDAGNAFASKPADRGDNMTNIVVDPGSIHKAITIGAALEEGVITPDTPITVAPSIHVGGPNDEPYQDHARPFPAGTKISIPAILAYSSNVGTIKIAQMLGPEKLYEYQRRFGLGQRTGISVPGEAEGLVQPPENWSGTSYGSIPIGLGVSATPIQMAAVYAAIAHDGIWQQPHLIKDFIAPDGTITAAAPPESHRVISAEHAAELRTMLEAVTTVDGATGRSGAVPGYRVAAKTGTGEMVINGHYGSGEVASFIGMAPADAPQYVVAVFAYTPGGGGGAICGPAFKQMMEFTLKHFRVPPTGTKPPTFQITYKG